MSTPISATTLAGLAKYDTPTVCNVIELFHVRPRNQGYMSQRLLEAEASRSFPANLEADYSSLTLMLPVRSDEPLVHEFLKQFFIEMDSPKAFEPFVNDRQLMTTSPSLWLFCVKPLTLQANATQFHA